MKGATLTQNFTFWVIVFIITLLFIILLVMFTREKTFDIFEIIKSILGAL